MKIAVSSTGKNVGDNVAEVFGRCPYFIIAEIENGAVKKTEAIKNESISQTSGAGMTAAKLMAEKRVKFVVAKNVGPMALDVLSQFNIEIFEASGKIEEALQNFIKKNQK